MIYDALVVGGGPAGATAALLLVKAGWSVAIVEKSRFPRRKVCGEFISATTFPLLEEIGIGGLFAAAAGPEVRRVGYFADDLTLNARMPESTGVAHRWGRALGREHLDRMILEMAARTGAQVWQPWSAVEVERRDKVFECTITAQGERQVLHAKTLIAAHGSWERGPLSPDVAAHRPSDLLAFKAHFTGSRLPDDLMPLLVFPGGYGGMVHTDGGRVTLSCCVRRDVLEACRRHYPGASAGEAVRRHIEAVNRGVREALAGAQFEGTWLAAGPIRPGIREFGRDGLFFVGNIAGEAHPIIAEGISMAIQSAWLLCRRLAAAGPDSSNTKRGEVARSYEAEWRSTFAYRLRVSAIFAALLTRPAIARAIAPAIRSFPSILTWCARLAGKVRTPIPLTELE